MVIDKILDRKDGQPYNAKKFYIETSAYGDVSNDIASAMDNGTEEDVKNALCNYVTDMGYSDKITDFINSVDWL
jgi:uncharacterized protein with LGFP repeats